MQDLSLLLLQDLECLTLLSLHLLICIMSCFFSFCWASRLLFSSGMSSNVNLQSFSCFSWRKQLLNYTLYFVFIPSVIFILFLTFSCPSKSSHSFFFSFLELFPFFFQYQTVFFEYLLWFYIHFLQISITSSRSYSFSDASSSPRPVALTSPLLFDLHLFMTVVKWSVPFFAVIQVIGYILLLVLLFLPQDLLSNIPLLFILLIMWMSFSLFHEMTDLKKVKNKRLVYKLFKTWGDKML